MIRKLLASCILLAGLVGGCRAGARVGPVHAGGGVSDNHKS